MCSIDLTVVSRIESLAVASLLEANASSTAGIFAACSVIFIYTLRTQFCKCEWNHLVIVMSDSVEGSILDFSLGFGLCDNCGLYFTLVLALWTGRKPFVSKVCVSALTELMYLSVNIHLN